MKFKVISGFGVLLMAICSLSVVGNSTAAERVEMLWNPGPNYRAGEMLANTGTDPNGCSTWASDMSEGALVGNPANRFTTLACKPNAVTGASNGAAPSFYVDTRVGWTLADLNQYPGYSVWAESGGGGSPIQFRFLNHALTKSDPCTLREVGLSYVRWPYVPDSMLRSNTFRLSEFRNVDTSFESRVPYSAGPPRCSSYPTGYVSADFHFTFVNSSGTSVQDQLLGVLLYVQPGTQLPPGSEPIFWQSSDGTAKILIGSRLSPAISQMTAEGGWQPYNIDLKSLAAKYVTPPPGYTIGNAIVAGVDIYSSVRGADLDLQVHGVDMYGLR